MRRKRHIIVDTVGLLLAVVVSEANMNDQVSAVAAMFDLSETGQKFELV